MYLVHSSYLDIVAAKDAACVRQSTSSQGEALQQVPFACVLIWAVTRNGSPLGDIRRALLSVVCARHMGCRACKLIAILHVPHEVCNSLAGPYLLSRTSPHFPHVR